MTTGIDLFAGLGGFTHAGQMAGITMRWAANHWPLAVQYHAANHPEVAHACQDLQQANWRDVPVHDVLLASPACQGHDRPGLCRLPPPCRLCRPGGSAEPRTGLYHLHPQSTPVEINAASMAPSTRRENNRMGPTPMESDRKKGALRGYPGACCPWPEEIWRAVCDAVLRQWLRSYRPLPQPSDWNRHHD